LSKPGETIVVLARALPHLPVELQGRTKEYLGRRAKTQVGNARTIVA
jgi:hypothetical protein